ncbi:DUF1822 family protein [Spirulina sp. CS-785/01]|uniref:DUF1822 family protein n=1 Tax=Spirulina sp. CS-785/01 TaxID=3021716 RepID=UPI00232D655A|nr:DUF1822 family protein [Spirulina sp. CS-785/01]MDB9312696.1 DUF1822 family protein [Spirulina sp. CS-785/01]
MTTIPRLSIPLGTTAHQYARTFAAEQATPEKGLQVYLNTLAVWSVSRYLQWLEVETDLTHSDSWNAASRALFNVADLTIPTVGKLECRPVPEGEQTFSLPPSLQGNRLGIVAVQYNDNLRDMELLGFYPTPDTIPPELSITELRSLDTLLETLDNPPIILSHWLDNLWTTGWEKLENLVTPKTPTFAFRKSPQTRGKQLNFTPPLLLILSLTPESDTQLHLTLQLTPQNPDIPFPHPVTVKILTESGEIFREIEVQPGDYRLQYEFSGEYGEKFSLQITQQTDQLQTHFII